MVKEYNIKINHTPHQAQKRANTVNIIQLQHHHTNSKPTAAHPPAQLPASPCPWPLILAPGANKCLSKTHKASKFAAIKRA